MNVKAAWHSRSAPSQPPTSSALEQATSADVAAASAEPMPEELSVRRWRNRVLQLIGVVAVIVILIIVGPGLGSLRSHLENASPGWLVAGVALEVLSALSYVVVFRAVFCQKMSWRLSYQIGMSEQAANSVLSVSGAGGLALGAWALHRGGMSTEHIARRTVAFFVITSLANVGGVIVFALLYAVGLLQDDPNPALTYAFGGAAALATAIVLALPALLKVKEPKVGSGKLARAFRFARNSLGEGVRDAVALLRQRSIGVIGGSLGFLVFDVAVLGVSFKAFGYAPPIGVLALGYLIGQLGGNIPVPGGIGGVDGGLIGTFALYHQPLAVTAAAVLVYHAIALWVPGLLGSIAFLQLRKTLKTADKPAAMCAPLAEPIEVAQLAA